MYGKRYSRRKAPYRRTRGNRYRSGYRRKNIRSRYRRPVRKLRKTWAKATTVGRYRKFIYNDEDFVASLAALTPSPDHVFRGNSIYDPDYTGVGVQPYGYDQVIPTFFMNYWVTASKITVYPSTRQAVTGESGQPGIKGVIVPYYDDALPYTEFTDVIRMPGARAIQFNADSLAEPGGNSISSYFSTRGIYGSQFRAEGCTANAGSNPANVWYWHVLFFRGPWQEDFSVNFDVKITYYTVLSKTEQLNES